MKRFSPMRDNQRGSQSYMKNRRGRKEIEVGDRGEQEEKKGDSRGERQIYTVKIGRAHV